MEKLKNSTIKSINLVKGEIVINKLVPTQKYDYLCRKEFYEKSLSKQEIENLKEGDQVTFRAIETEKGFYAQDIKIEPKESKLFGISKIKSIDPKTKTIIIHRLDNQQGKDFLCKQEYYGTSLSQEDISSLCPGTPIEFEYTIINNNYYASNLKLHQITTKHKEENQIFKETHAINTLTLTKQFIKQLKFTLEGITASTDFEDFTFFILKSLGISEVYAIPRDNAAGRCDGIFKISNISNNTPKLEVIYDCTLYPHWEHKKSEQINNYKVQICKNNISIDYIFQDNHTSKPVKTSILLNNNSEKQIWIITKNKTRIIESKQAEVSGEETSILVKEINIVDLINVLESKLLDTKYIKIDDIADKLKHL